METAERVQPKRLSAEEQERGLAILERLRQLQQEMLDERGGKPFSPAWELLEEARDERSRTRS